MDELLHQIERMRALRPLPVDRASLADHLKREIDELLAEPEGSDRAQDEAGDVVGVAVHLAVIDGPAERAIERVVDKLRRRLDQVEAGHSWAEAKRIAR